VNDKTLISQLLSGFIIQLRSNNCRYQIPAGSLLITSVIRRDFFISSNTEILYPYQPIAVTIKANAA
jgi:hypothetical protein